VASDYRVRVLTCVGQHNSNCLFELGERLARAGVEEWNVSRILSAGRAQQGYDAKWKVDDEAVLEQIHWIRDVFPGMRVRYSSRTTQEGYFLLILPDGSVATQYTDGRDKVLLGQALEMTLEELRRQPAFDLAMHARKWIGATVHYAESHLSEH